MPTGAVLATAVLAGMARVAHIDPRTDHAGHDPSTEMGCAVALGWHGLRWCRCSD